MTKEYELELAGRIFSAAAEIELVEVFDTVGTIDPIKGYGSRDTYAGTEPRLVDVARFDLVPEGAERIEVDYERHPKTWNRLFEMLTEKIENE